MIDKNGKRSAEDLRQFLHARLCNSLRKELIEETKATVALRKALLAVIILAGDKLDEPSRDFVDWLLLAFRHLGERLDEDNSHDFCLGQKVIRVLRHDGRHLEVLLPQALKTLLASDQ